jgi:hypothetical protein
MFIFLRTCTLRVLPFCSCRQEVTVSYTVKPDLATVPSGFTDLDLRPPSNNTLETALKEAEIQVANPDDDGEPFVS